MVDRIVETRLGRRRMAVAIAVVIAVVIAMIAAIAPMSTAAAQQLRLEPRSASTRRSESP